MPPAEIAIHVTTLLVVGALVLGLLAGVLGGLAGVGGSMLMLPGLHFLIGDEPAALHHLYIAAAFVVNVVVAYPAARRHRKSGAVRADLLGPLTFSVLGAQIAGIIIGNVIDGNALGNALGAFILAYCVFNVWRVVARHAEPGHEHARTGMANLIACGFITGIIGGMLGLAGGVILVPLLQLVCRLPLRASIATSSSVVWMTAAVAAMIKLGTLSGHGVSVWTALMLSGLMAPTALVGAQIGAALTHALPVKAVRIAITVILIGAAVRLLM